MIEAAPELTKEQIDFIAREFGIDEEALKQLDDDAIYDKVYDPCCVIEEVETVATLDDDSDLSERGRIAESIVTLLGNTIAVDEGYLDEDDSDDDIQFLRYFIRSK